MIEGTSEFFVTGFVTGEHFTVIGRCGDVPIQTGDRFDAIYRYVRRRYPDEVAAEPVREIERPASLCVLCIHAYQRSLPVLGQGMTGSLTIEGEGIEEIGPGWVLGHHLDTAAAGNGQQTLLPHVDRS